MGTKFTDEFIIDEIKRVAKIIGKSPTATEFSQYVKSPSTVLITKRFGWSNALKLAGLEPTMSEWNYEKINNVFSENGCKLLSTGNIDSSTKLKYICNCGNESSIMLFDFLKGKRCKECGYKKSTEKSITPYEEVKKYFEENGCLLLTKSDDYQAASKKVKYLCVCGNKSEITYVDFKKGTRCKECGKKRSAESRKIQFVVVQNLFEMNGCILLSSEKDYKNNESKIQFICSCGKYHTTTYENFKKSPRCPKCGYEIQKESTKLSYEFVKKYFEDNNCILLTENYLNNKQKLEYICECGEPSVITFDSFRSGHRCFNCGVKKTVEKSLLSYEYVKDIFSSNGCELLAETYINSRTPLKYKCECGNIDYIRLYDLIRGHRCKKCGSKKKSESKIGVRRPDITGSNHPQWDATKTPEEREKGRFVTEYKQWRNAVYRRDKFACQCCGDSKGGNLNAHHLDGWDWSKDRRFDLENGITLCDICHDDFHGIYGYGNNTKEQWCEYVSNLFEENPIFELA